MSEVDQRRVVRALSGATREVFSTMLGVTPEPGEAFTERDNASQVDGVVSLIGMAGRWVGTGSLSCSAETACDLSSRLLMNECRTVGEEVLDAFGELTNMVLGGFKNSIEECLGPMGLTIPTVICGTQFRAHSTSGQEWTVVPFRVAGQRLDVKVCLTPNPRQAGGTPCLDQPETAASEGRG